MEDEAAMDEIDTSKVEFGEPAVSNSKPVAEENARASASDVVMLTALVHEVLSLTRREREDAARRELRLSKELQMVTKRLGDLEEEVHALRSAIASSAKSESLAQPSCARPVSSHHHASKTSNQDTGTACSRSLSRSQGRDQADASGHVLVAGPAKSDDSVARSDPGFSSDLKSRPRVFVLKDSTREALEA